MHLPATFHAARRLALPLLIALGAASTVPGTALAEPRHAEACVAPRDLVGLDLNLQVEKAEGTAAASYPNQGVIVRRIQARGLWTSSGVGGPQHRDGRGTSHWHRDGERGLVETSRDVTGLPASSTFNYRFETPTSGRWTWQIDRGQATLSGSFTTVPSAPMPEQLLAPATNAGLHVPLIIKHTVSQLPAGVYPQAGLVLQTYAADGTLTFRGFGPGTIDSTGTYAYKRVSANTAVEETTQVSATFTLPYTMVYTYKTANSGVWHQNFANGLIYFSGTFDTFPR
ncbi:MAG: hypothetical protein EOP39_03980 [Rubrivivax sp.]|nr:MAG: hypothetical protein EOP39_03980 [Rubrivivax sp.]